MLTRVLGPLLLPMESEMMQGMFDVASVTSPVQIVSSIDARASIITVSVRGDRLAHGKPLGAP